MRRWTIPALLAAAILLVLPARAAQDFVFESIEGGPLALSQYRGGPVLVVNTASRCGFTYQYAGMQDLYDAYRGKGLTVVAVPSDDFRQELASNEAVKEFCEVVYGLDMPMTEITRVKGAGAHPFYAWLKAEHGFEPGWNFYKVLLDGEGNFVAGFTSSDRPEGRRVTAEIEKLLATN